MNNHLKRFKSKTPKIPAFLRNTSGGLLGFWIVMNEGPRGDDIPNWLFWSVSVGLVVLGSLFQYQTKDKELKERTKFKNPPIHS